MVVIKVLNAAYTKMKINYLKGDATNPQAKGNKMVVQICNDLGKWGKGFVMAVSKRWPIAREEYLAWHRNKTNFGLGEVQFISVGKYIWLANMIAQRGIKTGSNGPPIRYDSLEQCLEKVADMAGTFKEISIHMPRIGCGLAGGKWSKIEPLITKTLSDFEVYVYDF